MMSGQQVIEPVLTAVGVSKHFAGVTALDQVALNLYPGEVHALVGENGAGKSTLIKVLTGVYVPDEGEIGFLGEGISLSSPARRLGPRHQHDVPGDHAGADDVGRPQPVPGQ